MKKYVVLTVPIALVILGQSQVARATLKVKQAEVYPLTKNQEPILINESQKKRTYSLDGQAINGEQIIPQESARSKEAKKKIRSVAELYEKQFLRDMVKQMRSTVSYSELSKPSYAQGYFNEQLDQEYVEKWGEKGGIGFGEMIYKKLINQYGAQMGVDTKSE